MPVYEPVISVYLCAKLRKKGNDIYPPPQMLNNINNVESRWENAVELHARTIVESERKKGRIWV